MKKNRLDYFDKSVIFVTVLGGAEIAYLTNPFAALLLIAVAFSML